MSTQDALTEVQAIRHDLRNMLSALRSGCMLIEAKLEGTEQAEVQDYLDEMQSAIEGGGRLAERLEQLELDVH